jgi:nucleoside-diphosphate-sugar epimerase
MSNKLLVTGASGFIGKYLLEVPKLKHYEVLTPSSKELNLMDSRSISKYIEKNHPNYLIHLAWITNPELYKTSLDNIKWTRASENLFREFYRTNGFKIVAAGTGLEYDQQWGYFLEDVTPTVPNTLYGKCKVYTNKILSRYPQPYSWFRIFNAYGVGEPQSKLISNTIIRLSNNQPVVINNPDSIIDFIYVKDIANSMVEMLYKSHRCEINLSSGIPLTIGEVVDCIGYVMDKEKLISYPHSSPSTLYVGNNSKLCNMGLTPKYSLKSGVEEMISEMVGQ